MEETKSAFTKRATEMVHELTALLEAETAKDGKHRGFALIAAEEVTETSSANVIGVCGRGKEIAHALLDFAKQPSTKDVFDKVATIVAFEDILNK